ncbi:hypothetical protein GCM10027176_85280 [Actinoallomurus bryophytorum]
MGIGLSVAASVTVTHPIPTGGAFNQAFWLGAGAALLAAIAASLVPRSRARGSAAPAAVPGRAVALGERMTTRGRSIPRWPVRASRRGSKKARCVIARGL